MKTVLLVDDEKLFLASLHDGLKNYSKDFAVVTAENGAKAVACLASKHVDLVITDLNMPVLDGFELLAHMSKSYPHVPVAVMTAHGTPEIEKKIEELGVSNYIEKPVDFKALATLILNEFKFGSAGYIHGITLATFMQLIEMEKKTCTLTVKSENLLGHLFFRKGNLQHADAGSGTGIEAAYEMIAWPNAEIDISPRCATKTKSIDAPVTEILLEGCRRRDEKKRSNLEITEDDISRMFDEPADVRTGAAEPCTQKKEEIGKENIMALEQHLQGLKEVKGFKAAGIMNFTGEMLASATDDTNIDLSLVGATFNDIFRAAHEASRKIGLDACKETVINTPKGVIIMRCSGTDAKVHFHLIGIMAQDGNQALMKMQIEKMVPLVMQELA